MVDTSVLLAGLTTNHEHHELARTHVTSARRSRIAGIVVAETFGRLRGFPFNLDVGTTTALLAPWSSADRLLATPAGLYVQALEEARPLNLGSNIHDLLIVLTYQHHQQPLFTLDRRQAVLAGQRAIEVTLLVP